MQKLQFKKEIKASAEKVYAMMLGLNNKRTYQQWTSVFNATSTYTGNWENGSKMYFWGVDEKGKKGGLVSKIDAHVQAQFVSIMHYGFLDGENEITTGEQVEQWAGGHENYSFNEVNGITTITIDIDVVDDYVDYFNDTYPLALNQLKQMAEKPL